MLSIRDPASKMLVESPHGLDLSFMFVLAVLGGTPVIAIRFCFLP